MEGKFDYEKIMATVNKLAKGVSRKHRSEIVSDTLLLIYENEGSFINGKKIKPFVRKLFLKAKSEYFNRLKRYEISIGGIEDIEQIEDNGGYIL